MPDKNAKMDADTGVTVADIYREQYAHFRAMNDILYRMPPLFSVAIGGLWFFGATQMRADRIIAFGVFVFAAVLAVSSVLIMGRFGKAFSAYIKNLNTFDGAYKVTLKPETTENSRWTIDGVSTVRIIQGLLWVAFIASVIAAIYVPFAPEPQAPPVPAP